MRPAFASFCCLLALSACGQPPPPPSPPAAPQPVAAAPWFICDAISAPVILVFEREGAVARVAQYDKPNGAIVQRTIYELGAEEGAAGSVYTTLMQNGAEAGMVRQTNPGMLETPGAAYTPPIASVRIGEREIACRWLPRTRVMGITGRRTVVVHEDADGDLIYTSYDYAAAAEAQPIDLSENARTTTFSLEVRNGRERTSPQATQYDFQADAETEISVILDRSRLGRVAVRRQGPEPVQTEEFIAYVEAHGAE